MNTCRSCGAGDLTVFLSLGKLPLADGLLKPQDLADTEPRYPLDVALCGACSLVQILHTVPAEELFCRDYPYFSSYSDTLLTHSRKNVEHLIASRGLGSQSLVVELASNDGYLLQYFVAAGVPVLGIDPAEGPARVATDRGIPTLCTFFTRELAAQLRSEGKQADVIIGNNVLAHVPDLNGFVAGIATLLKEDGVVVIEAPYVRDLIDHNEFDTIYHEHLCYYSVTSANALFRRHGLTLVDVERLSIHGGSLRLYAQRGVREPSATVRAMLAAEADSGMTRLDYYRGFAARVDGVKRQLGDLTRSLRAQGKRLAGYGAAAKGTILLNYVGMGADVLDFVVDRNVHKQGRFVPGVRLPIRSPEALLSEMPDYVLILPWNFKDEILAQQHTYRERGGQFIVPIPEPVVV
jgi:SAM-dependent methyltransferase